MPEHKDLITHSLAAAIAQKPEALGPSIYPESKLVQSAVLIPCVFNPDSQSWEVLFTVRPKHLQTHSGQICLPGGCFDPKLDQSLEDTAVRECFEETGIKAEQIKLLGKFGYIDTLTAYRIHPYIGLIEQGQLELKLNQNEVDDYFFVALAQVLNLDIYHKTQNYKGFDSYYFHHGQYRVWGATARMLHQLAKLSAFNL